MIASPVEFASAFSTGLVAFTLLLSGVTKLGHSPRTLAAMNALRLPTALQRRWLARVVPLAELGIGGALLILPGYGRSASGVAALLLLAMFTVLLAGVLIRGDEVDCGCFGALASDDRVTAWALIRNGVLIAASLTIIIGSTGSTMPFIAALVSSDLTTVLSLALGWSMLAIIVLMRQALRAPSVQRSPAPTLRTRAIRDAVPPLSPASVALGIDPSRPDEVFMGDPIPTAEVVAADGTPQTLHQLAGGKPLLLVFLSVGCGTCTPVAEAIPAWREALHPIEIRVVTSSTPAALASTYPAVLPVARFGALSALSALGVQRSPAGVLLGGADNVIASPIAYGIQELNGLVASISSVRAVRTA